MSLDFSGLGDLAKQSPEKVTKGWEPLQPGDLGEGMVLAFDQSLTATGWAAVVNVGGLVTVTRAGTMKDPFSGAKNEIETQLRRGVHVFEEAVSLIDWALGQGYDLSHESPPNPAAVKGRGIGSLMAAQSVRNAAAVFNREIPMLGAQPAKKIVCGNANADKAEAHRALKEHCFGWIEGSDLVTNEATRDALMNALLWLYRQPKETR